MTNEVIVKHKTLASRYRIVRTANLHGALAWRIADPNGGAMRGWIPRAEWDNWDPEEGS